MGEGNSMCLCFYYINDLIELEKPIWSLECHPGVGEGLGCGRMEGRG